MKKNIYFLFFLLQISTLTFAQVPTWEWANGINGPGNKTIANTAIDKNGNCYISGSFKGQTVQIGSLILTNTTSTNEDMFLAKNDSSGNVLWANKIGSGRWDEHCADIAIDRNFNIYITGLSNSDTAIIGNSVFYNSPIQSGNLFIAKFDSAGNSIWTKCIKPLGFCVFGSNYLTTDLFGNVYITGHTTKPLIFGNDTVFNPISNGVSIFIAKIDSSGNLIWARNSSDAGPIGSSYYYNKYNKGIVCDKDGNPYISGWFYTDTIRFGNLFIADSTLNTTFITKYDSTGNVIWAKKFNFNLLLSKIIFPDNSNDLYFVGSTTNLPTVIKFGNDSLSVPTFGSMDVILGKIDSSGNFIWARTAGGTYWDCGSGLCSDNLGNIFITGDFLSSSISFGNISISNTDTSNSDLFIAKYDTSGIILWALGLDSASGQWISIDSTGDLICSGNSFCYSPNFGSNTILHYSGSGHFDTFIAKLGNSITGINNNIEKENDVILYPNPTTYSFTIKLPQETNYVQISNSLGQVLEKKIVKNLKEIDFNIKENGIYFVKVVCNKGIINKKVVVNK